LPHLIDKARSVGKLQPSDHGVIPESIKLIINGYRPRLGVHINIHAKPEWRVRLIILDINGICLDISIAVEVQPSDRRGGDGDV
jgi:hypothetical protein